MRYFWSKIITNLLLHLQLPLDEFNYLTRIRYKASNVPYDGKFGEHEIDYILFIQRDVELDVNENEVKSVKYVSQEELKEFLGQLLSCSLSTSLL